jgi:sulfonate transport system substrate-binding protein
MGKLDIGRVSPARRTWLKGFAAGGAMLSMGDSWSAAKVDNALRLGVIGPTRAPVFATGYAMARGYLQRELEPLGFSGVSFNTFVNGPDLNEAFLSGALDVGIYGDTPAVVARARGLDARLIGLEDIGMNTWLLTPRGGVSSVRELDGKVVAVALGSYMHRYVLGALREAGIARSTRIVYMLARDAGAALEKGSVDAFAAQVDVGPLLASRGFPVIDEAARHPALLGSSVIVASTDVLRRAPQLPAAWNRARRNAIGEIQRDSDAYYAFHAAQTGFPVDAIKASHPVPHMPTEPYPSGGLQLLGGVKRFLLDDHLIRNDFSLEQWRV